MVRRLARVAWLFYGVMLVAGGVLGYLRRRSTQSLLAGSSGGLLSLLAAWLATRYPRAAHGIAAAVATTITAVMGYRWEKTGHVMPAGAVAMVSGGMALLAVGALLRD